MRVQLEALVPFISNQAALQIQTVNIAFFHLYRIVFQTIRRRSKREMK